jgi:hypothetical protein
MAKELRLKNVPDDVMDIIYEKQLVLKKIAQRNISIEKAVFRLIRLARGMKEAS